MAMAWKTRWVIVGMFIFLSRGLLYGDANVLLNPGFEDGTAEWAARSCTFSTVTSPVHSGSRSGRATNRTDTWQGIQQNMLDKMVIGGTYRISGWVRISSSSDTVKVSIQKTVNGVTTYANVDTATANNSEWVEVSGYYTLTASGTLTDLWVYFEGPASGVTLYVDDAVVYGPEPAGTDPETTGQVDVTTRHQVIEGI